MNKERYLKYLSRLIRRLPDDERERVLEFYREIIEDKMESGETEEQAVGELGDVRILAQKILSDDPNRTGFKKHHGFVHSDEYDDYTEKTYAAEAGGIRSIVLEAEDKAIRIVPSDTDEITVDYAECSDDSYDFSSENGVFRMKHTGKRRSRVLIISGEDGAGVIIVKVPASYEGDFSVSTVNSYISIGKFGRVGTVACRTENSAIHLDGTSAKTVICKTRNAAIKLKDVAASEALSAETTNAVIALNGIASPDISLETTNALISGSISGRREDYTAEVRTTNAISNLQSGGGGTKKLKVKTTNAIIRVSFRQSSKCEGGSFCAANWDL